MNIFYHKVSISTHSLTRRLTGICHKALLPHKHFNSQPHKEADIYFRGLDDETKLFQLTASQGG